MRQKERVKQGEERHTQRERMWNKERVKQREKREASPKTKTRRWYFVAKDFTYVFLTVTVAVLDS